MRVSFSVLCTLRLASAQRQWPRHYGFILKDGFTRLCRLANAKASFDLQADK